MKILFVFLLICTLEGKNLEDKPSERNLISNDELHGEDSSKYLGLFDPEMQHMDGVKVDAQRLGFIQKSNRWITKLNKKLDGAKFLVNSRLELMGEALSKKLKSEGFNPVITYHRMYNKLMNPLTNPYLQMTLTNSMMAPPQMNTDPTFRAFQNNLSKFANTYADSVAFLKAGLYDKAKPNNMFNI